MRGDSPFCQLKFYQEFPNFFGGAKLIEKMPLGGDKDEHFSCFHSLRFKGCIESKGGRPKNSEGGTVC